MGDARSTRADRMARVAAGAVLCVPAVALSFAFPERFRFAKEIAGEALAFVGVLATVVARWQWGGRQPGWRAYAWDLPVAAAAISFASASPYPVTAWREVLRLAGLSSAALLFMTMDRPRRLAPLLLLAAGGNAALALLQGAGLGLWETSLTGRHAVYGTFGNPNLLAEWLVLAVPALVVACTDAPRGAWRIAAAGTALLVGVTIVTTGGRAAALALMTAAPLVGLALTEASAERGQPRRPWPLVAALSAGAVLFVGVLVVREWRPSAAEVRAAPDPTSETRRLMREVARVQWHEHLWLGNGPGGYRAGFLAGVARVTEGQPTALHYAGVTAEAHCDPLQALAEGGLLGALAWAAALLAAAGVWRGAGLGAPRSRLLSGMAMLAIAAVVASVSFPFHVFPTAVLFVWCVAVLADEVGARDAVPAAGSEGYGLARSLACAAGLLFLGRVLVAEAALGRRTEAALRAGLSVLPAHGELHFRLGLGLSGAGRLAEAEGEFLAALPGCPDPDVRFNLGWIALQRKDYPSAAARFEEGLRLYPFFKAAAWADYALALSGLGRRAEAIAAARRALDIDPQLVRAQALVMQLERKGER